MIEHPFYYYPEIDSNILGANCTNYPYAYFIQSLCEIDKFVHEVLATESLGFSVSERVIGRAGRIEKNLRSLAMANHFFSMYEWVTAYHLGYEYRPYVDLFFKQCIKLDLINKWLQFPSQPTPSKLTSRTGITCGELFNELLHNIRQESQTTALKQLLYRQKENSNRNFKSAREYISCLFSKHSRLLVLRVDLTYHQCFTRHVSAEDAKKDFEHFLNNFKHNRELSTHVKGYIWKMEFGYLKGFHFHFLLFYDSAYVNRDSYWAERLGKYWVGITSGKGRSNRGSHWNCNRPSEKAKYQARGKLGIGKIHRDDIKLRNILINDVMSYLPKSEQALIATRTTNSRFKTFDRGQCTYKSHKRF